MKMKIFTKISFLVICAFALRYGNQTTIAQVTTGKEAPPDGAKLYEQRCATCHDHPVDRIPPKSVLQRRTADEVIATMTTGSMRTQAGGLRELEIRALAVYLTGKQPLPTVDPSLQG